MAQPAAKEGDKIISDPESKSGPSLVWIQGSQSPITSPLAYDGSLKKEYCSKNVFIMGKPAAIVSSKADDEDLVGKITNLLTKNVDTTATITTGSSTVCINGKKASRNGDKANTWDYSTPTSPGIGKEVENAKVEATGSVYIED